MVERLLQGRSESWNTVKTCLYVVCGGEPNGRVFSRIGKRKHVNNQGQAKTEDKEVSDVARPWKKVPKTGSGRLSLHLD